MKLTRLTFEVRVPENDLAAYYERAKIQGIQEPTVRLNQTVTQAVLAVIERPTGLPALHDEREK